MRGALARTFALSGKRKLALKLLHELEKLATERRNLGLRWLRLAEKAKATPLNRVREPAPKP